MKRYIVFVVAMSALGLAIGVAFGAPCHTRTRLYLSPTSHMVPERHRHMSRPLGPPDIAPARLAPSNLPPPGPPQPVVTLIRQGQHDRNRAALGPWLCPADFVNRCPFALSYPIWQVKPAVYIHTDVFAAPSDCVGLHCV